MGYKYNPCAKIRVESGAIGNEFYAWFYSDWEIKDLLEKNGRVDKQDTDTVEQQELEPATGDIKENRPGIDNNSSFVFNAGKDSIDFFRLSWNKVYHTTTGKLSVDLNCYELDKRIAVYFPETGKIYVSQFVDLKQETINFYKITGDVEHPFKITTVPMKWILALFVGLLFISLMTIFSIYTLKSLGYEPDKRSKFSIVIISLLFWLLFSNVIVYTDFIGAILTFPFFALPTLTLVFITQLHLRIEGKRKIKRLLAYTIMQNVWIMLFTLLYYNYVHQYWG